ncbi:MAG: ribonuclease HII [Candidatus Margulisbacteria bacterium]|nr:ribonuclease HII [Candidatus Margulisiibacteriota bacterium]
MLIAGIDEAGRGALAGPVVAAAVIFTKRPEKNLYSDSKKLTAVQREELYPRILRESLAVGIGVIDFHIIDKVNILYATFLAMQKALQRLKHSPDIILIDGNQKIPDITIKQKTVVKGDALVPVISAASIVAKVIRDRIMQGYARIYKDYAFEVHKGYGTSLHQERILQNGLCPIHRRTFNKPRQLVLF